MTKYFTAALFAFTFLITIKTFATERMLLVGGGALPPAAVEKFVQLAGKDDGRILVIGWASKGPEIAVEDFKRDIAPFFNGVLDASLFAPINDLERIRFLNQVSQASGIWFVGGYIERIMVAFNQPAGDELKQALAEKLRQGVIVGGTSAGASIMANPMLLSGDSPKTVKLADGLGFAHPEDQPFIIDQHFTQRKHEERLIAAMKLANVPFGVGLDEDTAMLIIDRRFASAIGRFNVRAFRIVGIEARETSLRHGERFDLTSWKK